MEVFYVRFHSIELTVARGAIDIHASGKPSLKNINAPEVGSMLVPIANDIIDRGWWRHVCQGCDTLLSSI